MAFLPLQSPVHRLNSKPGFGVAVSSTRVRSTYVAMHRLPQSAALRRFLYDRYSHHTGLRR